jgi:hypothetical protein
MTLLGTLLKVAHLLPRQVMFWWFGLTPVPLLLANYFGERFAEQGSFATRRHLSIDANGVGAELAQRNSRSVPCPLNRSGADSDAELAPK